MKLFRITAEEFNKMALTPELHPDEFTCYELAGTATYAVAKGCGGKLFCTQAIPLNRGRTQEFYATLNKMAEQVLVEIINAAKPKITNS